jgi:hypothetical protein
VFSGAERFQEQSVFKSRAVLGVERLQEQSVFKSRVFLVVWRAAVFDLLLEGAAEDEEGRNDNVTPGA